MPNCFLEGAPIDEHEDHEVFTYVIDHNAPADKEEAAELLYDAVVFAHKQTGVATCVLDVHLPILPGFIKRAAESLLGFGAGLVVLHEGRCSLDEDCGFPRDLQLALARARRHGAVWHPIKRKSAFMLRQGLAYS